jgi:hypothetical protein
MILQNNSNLMFLKEDGTLTDNEYDAKRYQFKVMLDMCINKIVPEGFNPVCNPEDYI